jgi:hypothetical protein
MQVTEAEGLKQEAVQQVFVGLVGEAKKSVFMSTDLYLPFYQSEDVKKSLIKAASVCSSFRIVVDNRVDAAKRMTELDYLIPLARDGKVSIRQAVVPVPHWWIVDRKNMRLERPHPIEAPSGTNMQIMDATDDIVEQVETEIDRMWVMARGVTIPPPPVTDGSAHG